MSDEYDSDSGEEVGEETDEEVEEEVVVKKKRKGKNGKDPNKPKRNMSAFFLYSQANRSQVKADNPEASFGDIARLLSAKFKALGESDHAKWVKKAEKDKERYQKEMANYVPPEPDSDDEPTGRKKKKKKDPNAPKRNMSAFFLYSNFIRPKVKEDNPGITFGDTAKMISEQFKKLDSKERAKWDKKAAEDKERYQQEMRVYNGED